MGNQQARPPTSVGIVECAVNKGQPKEGVETGPKAMREGGLNEFLNSVEKVQLREYQKISQTQAREKDRILNCLNQKAFIKSSHEIRDEVKKSVAENDITLILGGDHSLAYGSIHGHFDAYPNTFVVWVDAHSDINTPAVSASGNIHGMPLAFCVKETSEKIPQHDGFETLKPCMTAKNLLYIGLRDVDTPELEYLKEYNIRYFNMLDVREIGIEKVVELTLKAISEQHVPLPLEILPLMAVLYSTICRKNCNIHLSFDIDGLDPKFANSTGTPVPGGLTLDEGKHICRSLAMTGEQSHLMWIIFS
ncbi:unnamed protein product [Dibothriocephalus latus]|uniref:Arginase n=1 Tax=Dibothriocephalus latus TaxID=60516 RepID=A0A3P6SYA6_DIBLA|nr:unnamed protein product [Dibothriocephalus latus]